MINSKKRIFLWLPLLIFLGLGTPLRAEEPSQEYQLKLAFMVNFARFITWPAEAFAEEQQMSLCVLGKNPFGPLLSGVGGKKVGERSLKVLHFETLADNQQCHLLFVGQADVAGLTRQLQAVSKKPVVTVSDSPGFAEAGGGIEFVIKGDKLSFIINNSALKDKGVQASSSLLNLAASVR
jgi:YfiR/HmsC-like